VTVKKPHHFRPRVGFVVYENIIEQFVIPVLDEDFNCVLARALLMKRGIDGIIMEFVLLEVIVIVVPNCFVDPRMWVLAILTPAIPTLQWVNGWWPFGPEHRTR
jgi:hypothetical protein